MKIKIVSLLLSILTVGYAEGHYNLFFDEFKDTSLPRWNIVGTDYVNASNESVYVKSGAVISPRINIVVPSYRVSFDLRFIDRSERIYFGIRANRDWYSMGFYINADMGIISFIKYMPNKEAEIVHSIGYPFEAGEQYKIAVRDDRESIILFINDSPRMALSERDFAGQIVYIKSYGEIGVSIDNFSITSDKDWSQAYIRGPISIAKNNNPPIHKVQENSSTFPLLFGVLLVLVVVKWLWDKNNPRTK